MIKGLSLYKNINMKLIYITSTITMEPKNYSTIRSILKKEQEEKISPYVLKSMTPKLPSTRTRKKITCEIYQEVRKIINHKQTLNPAHYEPTKKQTVRKQHQQPFVEWTYTFL